MAALARRGTPPLPPTILGEREHAPSQAQNTLYSPLIALTYKLHQNGQLINSDSLHMLTKAREHAWISSTRLVMGVPVTTQAVRRQMAEHMMAATLDDDATSCASSSTTRQKPYCSSSDLLHKTLGISFHHTQHGLCE